MAVTAQSSGNKAKPSGQWRAGRDTLLTRLGIALVAMSVAAGVLTFAILTGLTSVTPSKAVVTNLQLINGALATALVFVIAWQVIRLWRARRAGLAGARLHVRLVTLFSMVAAVPVLIVAVFASVTLDRGLDTLFSNSTRAIVDSAVTVAESHVRGYEKFVNIELTAMSNALSQPRVVSVYEKGGKDFPRFVSQLRLLSSFHVIYMTRQNGQRLLVSSIDKRAPPPAPAWALQEAAKSGKPFVIAPQRANLVLGIVKLKGYEDVYLQGYRYFDKDVVANLQKADKVKQQYISSERDRRELQITFALISISVSLVFLLAAIWLGLRVADRLVAPIVRLMDASRQVSRGLLDVEVPVRPSEGDLAALGLTFNRMTEQLRNQRKDLIGANEMLDERRRFIEAVLSGVSAGVIGMDDKGVVTLANRSAQAMLDQTEQGLLGKKLERAVPEFKAVLSRIRAKKSAGMAEAQINLVRDGAERSFVVRVMREQAGSDSDFGYVLTFDDTTELVSAQRTSAWADIARRIAHEIKNPLTPIQLSAERLRRRYGDKIAGDRQVFDQCTQTIIRQVGDIGRMVDEFSSFARMPKAMLEPADLVEVIKEGDLLQRVSQANLEFELDLPAKPVIFDFDRRLVTQAITNLVKNATEAVEARLAKDKTHKGHIRVALEQKSDRLILAVCDNGIGLPGENRQRLLEPYMTTREKGTGLGLAIVKKIMEEHHGRVELDDDPQAGPGEGGAVIRLVFPVAGPRVRKSGKAGKKAAPAAKRKGKTRTPAKV
jgi:two-component system nitrogen regulation sensor histidine kinase NtrY